ncbi:ATP-binding protein [Microvirga arvi]|uniref:ATP-binding protein n=1 Tax=Microvirga arvi TaxID=2778731 RepID=UPI001EF72300|nr:ATP-binding protein [Microvirga arvi]
MLCAALLFQVIGTLSAQEQSLGRASHPERIFIGSRADHFVDPTGQSTIETVAANPSLFTPANGRTANRGVSPSRGAAFWLRLRMPNLTLENSWVISLHESRIAHAVLFVPAEVGWRSFDWNPKDDYAAGRELLRYPAFHVDAASIAGQEIFIRVETNSSMRAVLWLETERTYAATYGDQSLAFGGLIGALTALFAYLLAIGWALKDGALLRLSALVLSFMVYVVADKAFLETALVPGAFDLSRMASLSGSLLTFAAWLSFEACYLKVRAYRPLLNRVIKVGIILLLIFGVQVVIEIMADVRMIRLYSSYIGLVALAAGVGLALAMMRYEWRRSLVFLLCWLPAIAGGSARLLLDAADSLAPHPLVVNAVYLGAGFSLLIFGIVTSLDIQARERRLLRASQSSEARFRSFADSASDSFWETDAKGRLAYLAGQIDSQTLGVTHKSDFIESMRGTSRASSTQGLAVLEKAFRERTGFRSVVLTVQEKSGSDRYLAVSGTPSIDTQGRYCGHRGIFSDVTKEMLLNERQMQQQKMAALGQLAGGVAHEINNLLHPIINLTRRVRGSFDPTDGRRYQMGIVEDAGLRAQEIVAGILTTVRPTLQTSPLVPFDQALAKAVDAVRPAIPAAVELDVKIDHMDTFSVPLGEVLQVISNLIANAVHALRRGGRIEISLIRHAQRNGATLCIADDGEGMDADTRRQAFEPFFTTKSTSGGTGLGLALVYRIVTGWGASIDIQSEVKQGTKFVITLPDGLRNTREEANGHAEPMSDPGDR